MTTRRDFLKSTIKTTAGLALIPLVNLPSLSAMAAEAAEKVPLNDPAAAGLKYTEDATTAARTEKMGHAADTQFCHNCQFYAAGDAEWGGCALFQNRLVAAQGWCLGWVPKAA